jgi:hypothetical protein
MPGERVVVSPPRHHLRIGIGKEKALSAGTVPTPAEVSRRAATAILVSPQVLPAQWRVFHLAIRLRE